MKKLTIEEFTKKAKKIHGNKYDYSLVDYQGFNRKVKIKCSEHGIFEQTPHHHLTRKQECNKCRRIKINKNMSDTTENFIKKAKKIHGVKYDYSLVNYVNRKTKVKILCSTHGIFEQEPHNHINGQSCGKCFGLHKTNEDFINISYEIHGNKYDYSLVDYQGFNGKVKIKCLKHGIFEQTPQAHLNLRQGCPKCVGMNKTTEEFIYEARLIHGDKYEYSLVDYVNSKLKINIICLKHGGFNQSPNMHLRGNGCPICKESKGEKLIREFLIKNNIKFIQEHTFKKCKNKQVLPFDFYLPDYNVCIEFDGIQHFKPIKAFGGQNGFDLTKQNDLIKDNFCNTNNLKLIRIPYFCDVSDSLKNFCTK
jgi:hypothetical protein